MQADQLDQHLDLRLGASQPQLALTAAQAPRQRGQIEHQRGVSERQVAEVGDHVAGGLDRAGQGPAPRSLCGAILVPPAPEDRQAVIELDDRGNVSNPVGQAQGLWTFFPTLSRMTNVDNVTEALRDVIDPELGLDFVELGLIYDVEIDDETVRVTYTLTSPGCPIGPQVAEQIEEFVGELDGVAEVQPTMTFSPPWTPERMSEDAKFALGF
jgi:metal-sulfur cluster biosynthetic enzyme